jgi:pimeloyl-ACP methyl ester carboxylesterase
MRFARLRRFARWCLMLLLTLYLLLAFTLYCAQGRLIFSGRRTQGRESAVVHPLPGTELVHLTTAGGDRIVALFGPALDKNGKPCPDPAKHATMLFFYGNAMSITGCFELLSHFRRLGVNVLIPEYPGYGMSTGSPSEVNCYAAADAAYDYLRTRRDVDPARIVAAGWSLGGAIAIDLASRRPVCGLATVSTFSSMADVAASHYPFLPVGLLLKYRFASDAKIRRVTCPILLAHGTDDRLVPTLFMNRLQAPKSASVTRLRIDGAGHEDIFEVGGDRLYGALGAFCAHSK